MKRHLRWWTPEDETLAVELRRNGMPIASIAEQLGRKPQSVNHKLMRLNVGVLPRKRGWSKVEERRLLRLWPLAPQDEINRAFPGRTWDSISVRAAVLGVHRSRLATAEEEQSKIAALSETECAYIAGLFDGEGSLVLTGRWYRMSLGLTYEPTVRWLETTIGGGVTYYSRDTHPEHNPVWAWRLTKTRAIRALLGRIYPYLQIKAEKARVALGVLS